MSQDQSLPYEDDDHYDEDDIQNNEVSVLGSKKRHCFGKELKLMMHGFGDEESPYIECIDILDNLVVEFIKDMTRRAMEVGRSDRVHVEDIVFLIRKDPKKYTRVKELLTMNEELKKARKAFEEENFV